MVKLIYMIYKEEDNQEEIKFTINIKTEKFLQHIMKEKSTPNTKFMSGGKLIFMNGGNGLILMYGGEGFGID